MLYSVYAIDSTIEAAIISFCILLLYFSMVVIIRSNILIREEKRKLSEINDKLQKEEIDLRENERSYSVLLSNLPGMAYRCKYDRNWTMLFVSEGCLELTGYPSSSLIYNAELTFKRSDQSGMPGICMGQMGRRDGQQNQICGRVRDHNRFRREEMGCLNRARQFMTRMEMWEALEGLIINITDRKKKEDEIVYLNYHDYLTGIYNRRFLELQKEWLDKEDFLPLSVLIGDINGVKLVNDALGHAEGDILIAETAKIIQSCCRENDIAARTGGDEFIILMPFTDGETANKIMEKIKQRCSEYNQDLSNEAYSINISLGYAAKTSINEHLDGTIKLAEEYMYKRKLLEHKSSHSVILSSIKATMQERSHETQEHAERLTHLARETGIKLNLTQQDLDELELVATLHDIGKVAVDDRILNKPDKLNDKEWLEMKRHSEIGYRIAMSSPDLAPISEYILSPS